MEIKNVKLISAIEELGELPYRLITTWKLAKRAKALKSTDLTM